MMKQHKQKTYGNNMAKSTMHFEKMCFFRSFSLGIIIDGRICQQDMNVKIVFAGLESDQNESWYFEWV